MTSVNEFKVIITGSGKTSAIAAVSEIPLIQAQPTDLTTSSGPRMIAVDYGELTLSAGVKVCLYGTEGQAQFDYLWRILLQGARGLIILVNHSGSEPIRELAGCLANFREFLHQIRIIIGVTHLDLTEESRGYHAYLQAQGLQVPILAVDAGSRASVEKVVQTLVDPHQIFRNF